MLVRLPNAFSSLRILLVPAMLAFAWNDKYNAFLLCFLAALLTDALDGFLARRFHLRSRLGAVMDSWGDALAWLAFIAGSFRLWPEVYDRQAPWIAVALTAFLLPGLLGLIRYRRLAGFHTWGAKISMALMGVSVLPMFGGLTALPFRMSTVVLALAAAEQCVIILWLPEPRGEVRSLLRARELRASGSDSGNGSSENQG